MRWNQRQAALALLSAQFLYIIVALLIDTEVRRLYFAPAVLGIGGYALLLVLYWQGWKYAGQAVVVFMTLLVSFAVNVTHLTDSISFVVLLPPIYALIFAGPLWVVGSLVVEIALLSIRAGGDTLYTEPITLVVLGAFVGSLLLSQFVLNNALHISEERAQRIDEQLQHLEQHSRAIRFQASLLDAVDQAVIAVNDHGCVTYWGHFAEKLYGYAPVDVLHQQILEFPPFTYCRPQFEEIFRSVREQGSWSGDISFECPRRGKLSILLTANPLVDRPNNATIVLVSVDITALKQAEEAVTDRETRYRLLVEMLPDILFRLDSDGTYLDYNAPSEGMLLIPPEQFLGAKINELLPPNIAQPAMQAITTTLSTGKLQIFEYQIELQQETLSFEGRVIAAPGNEVLVIIRDMTEQKQLEQQLFRAQRMDAVGRLAGGVAHDFNNLLMAIGGYTDLAKMAVPPDAPVCVELDEIEKSVQRAAALTRQLLTFARKQPSNQTVTNLNDLVMDIENLLRNLLGANFALRIELDPHLHQIKVDRHQIEQVLVNLVINARDAMQNDGVIVITTANTMLYDHDMQTIIDLVPGEYVRVAVIDTGSGMDAATCARAFEPFFTTKEADKGTGLGLATCYGIVKQHNGSIIIDSVVGQGTTMAVYLPIVTHSADCTYFGQKCVAITPGPRDDLACRG